jgi:hypothetical protein
MHVLACNSTTGMYHEGFPVHKSWIGFLDTVAGDFHTLGQVSTKRGLFLYLEESMATTRKSYLQIYLHGQKCVQT